jgi:hypothetical protein
MGEENVNLGYFEKQKWGRERGWGNVFAIISLSIIAFDDPLLTNHYSPVTDNC